MTKQSNQGADKPFRKRAVLFVAKVIILPFLPLAALGYWASYDGDKSYLWCLKDMWRDF